MLNLLEELKGKNIHISVKDNNLVIDTTEDIEESLIKRIRVYKEEIISYILKHNSNSITKHTSTGKDHPVSDAQKRLWLQSLTEEGSKSYHINFPVEFSSSYDPQVMRLAVLQLIKNFEIFRTVFHLNDEVEVRQIVLEENNIGFDVEVIDLKEELSDIKVIEEAVKNLNSQAFDLGKGPLLRCKIFELKDKIVAYFIFHHIIIDGVSLNVVKQNILTYYHAIVHSEEISGPKLQYLDYTYWKLAGINNGNYNAAQRYWTDLLSKKIPTINLPSYAKRPSVKTFNSYSLKTVISSELTQKLDAFAKQNMGTLNVSLLSAVYVLLNKYTSENDITLGTFTSGRNHPSLNEIPGLFVNTIVLNNILDPQKDTLTDTFRKVKESFTKAFTHQDYPFDLLIEDLHLSQDTSRNPLFDITVVFQDYLDNESAEVYSDEIEDIGFTKRAFDINFEFINKGSFLEMIVAFNADVYDKKTITSFINHLKQVLHQFVSAADIPLKSLDYISAEERAVMDSFNHTQADYPSDETIVSLFEKQVSIAPDHPAVIYGGISLSYSELNARSNQLAYYLREKYSIEGDDLICIQLPRSENMLVAILGILKSGGAYVPISPDYPLDRTNYILSDTQAKINIDESFLLEFEFSKDIYSTENPESVIRQDRLAYVIYTSGTTGNPKGVMIEHGSLVNRLMWMQSRYPLADGDVLIQKTPYTFDVSVWELLWWCIYGATLSVSGQGTEKDPSLIIKTVEKDHVSVIHFVPSMFTAFLNHIDTYPEEKQKLISLKTVFTSGEALSVYQKELFYRLFPEKVSLVNLYGPTEACIDVTYYDCKKDLENTIIPIGQPIDNTQMYVLDHAHCIVPIGVTGELYISGDGLARGYLNRVELTEEKFVDNPFTPGAKMYRTGDLGRWLPDGTIEYLGRIDHQVKIRGHRIELGEIDSQVLSLSESIKSVVTEVKEHEGDKSLVVYYVSDTPIDKQDLARHLESKLPKYMLPGFYVELDQIPLTSNGKIDRKSLREVSSSDLIKNEYVAATSEEEKVLVSVCEQILKYSPISIRDNYYNLGGDSIKSIQIVSRLRQQGYSLKVEHILQYPVLEELARYMTTDVAKIDQSVVTGDSILTPIQRYFFESECVTNKNHYNQSVILKSRERMSASVLETSLKRLVEHHDALRMVYSQKDREWNQHNAGIDGAHYRLESFDIKSGSESEELSQLQQIGEDLQSSIDIESGILFHAGHVSMSDGDRIILVVHHLVMDGVSWRILLEDLGKLYESGGQGLSFDLPSKTDSFQSWGKALDEYSRSLELSKERLYWEGVESENYIALATDYPSEGKQILDKSIGFSLSSDSTKLLQTRAGRKYSAEINDVLLTGLALALQDQFGITRTKVLMEGHGREVMNTGLDISRTIGWFTSVYPFSLDISNNNQPALVSVKEGLRNIPNKGIGYGILHDLKKEISSQSNPSVLFNYLGDFNEEGDKAMNATGKFSFFRYSSENIGSSVDPVNLSTDILFDVSGMTVNGEMNISIRYSTKVFKESTIENLLSAYQAHLEAVVKESEDSSVILTPSDLTYKGLSFNTIAEISNGHEIEDIYELSPMQQGLYFHWLVNAKGSAYFVQTSYRVKSTNLDLSLVEKAFGMLLNRYTILRTSFENRYGEVPLQVVHKKARVDFRHLILGSETGLDNIKQEDIDQGFVLSEPTQMRLVVVELPDNYYEFIWSHHHIVMDGWCLSILINDFATILQSLQQQTILSLPEAEKYSSYIQWLKSIDKEEVLTYWEDYLQGKDSPTLIPFAKEIQEDTTQYELSSHISFVDQDVYKEIVQFCKNSGITLNTYIQAIWSYLLSAYNDFDEVIFGAVVSGRPPEVRGIESMVGLFINTVPVRVAINKDETPQILLDRMHRESIGSAKYHYLSLAEIQNKSTLKRNLINHILIFENFLMAERSVDPENDKDSDSLKIEKSKFQLQTSYPFNFEVFPTDKDLRILVDYNKNVFDDYSVINIVRVFKEILAFFKENINVPFAEITDELEKQSIYFKAIRQKDIKEIVTTADSDLIKQKNSNKLSAFIKNKK
ncbi:non-ribosomal peptide synthetase [Chryseobacterium gregarium]|uniref:non-ribosomal peptide synthetase n=1 Tax=Chryseobacterium gregarium TaxID=456299 RepID=UPI00041701BE|nr:non-ribosomal peptide synthetase [Chryseobacterium gregarium]